MIFPSCDTYSLLQQLVTVEKLPRRYPTEKGKNNLTIIDQSGAKRSELTFLSLRPQNTTLYQTAQVAALLVSKGIVGICFCDSRELVKTLTNTIRKNSERDAIIPPGRNHLRILWQYEAESEKTRFIADIQYGKVKFIVSTSALEAGLDIGSIDATVVHSYPGSILAFRQRAGRAGRQEAGLLVFIPSKRSIMDSYYSKHPDRLLSDPPEIINFNHTYENYPGKITFSAAAKKVNRHWLKLPAILVALGMRSHEN